MKLQNPRNAIVPSEQSADDHGRPFDHQAASPTLFNPFNDPRLSARPWDLLRMRTKPVTGPSSPSFSMLKFASASSPATS